MDHPELSVVFATMNRLDHLRRTVESIRAELDGRRDYELVIVDGGSTDGTGEWLATLPRTRVIHEEQPRGCCYAFDLGLRAARGEWVCWLNDDVHVSPGAFERMFAFMTAPGNERVGMGAFPNSRQRNEPDNYVVRAVFDFPIIYADFGFIRRSLLESLGFLDTRFRTCGWDPDLACRVWEKGYLVAPCEGANITHFFAEDVTRRDSGNSRGQDTEYLLKKWDPLRGTGFFYSVYEDRDYFKKVRNLLAGWPGLNLRLHFADTDGLVEKARKLFTDSGPSAAPPYYRLALEFMKRRRFDDAGQIFAHLAETMPGDPMHSWYVYKTGESLQRQGLEDKARPFIERAASLGHERARMILTPEDAPLRLSLGNPPLEGRERIRIRMNVFDTGDWHYHFRSRLADDVLMRVSGTDMGADPAILAGMAGLWLARDGRVILAAAEQDTAGRRLVAEAAEELRAHGFNPAGDNDIPASTPGYIFLNLRREPFDSSPDAGALQAGEGKDSARPALRGVE